MIQLPGSTRDYNGLPRFALIYHNISIGAVNLTGHPPTDVSFEGICVSPSSSPPQNNKDLRYRDRPW